MPQGPAARVGDPVAHPLPPVLGPGPGSVDVLIGGMPAWRGMPLAAAAGLLSAKASSDAAVAIAVAASTAAAGTPGAPAAIAAETTAKQTATSSMTAAMSAAGAGADAHMCATPFPPTVPLPHSQGMVITGSMTVLINNLPACRAGDTILECMGPPNSIAMGCPTVMIGDSMYMGPGGGVGAASRLAPGGGLAAHEAAGGHVIDRHVGRTDEQLAERLANEPALNAASTFTDRATAESAVARTIDANQPAVDAWLAGNSNQLVVKQTLNETVGRVLPRGGAAPSDASSVRVVLRRDPSLSTGYRIHTAYPEP